MRVKKNKKEKAKKKRIQYSPHEIPVGLPGGGLLFVLGGMDAWHWALEVESTGVMFACLAVSRG